MYYRITTFSFDPAREDELMTVAQAAADEMKAIVGIQSAVIVRIAEGKTVTIAAYDTEASAIAAQPKVQAVLAQLAGMLTGQPEIRSGPVLFDFF